MDESKYPEEVKKQLLELRNASKEYKEKREALNITDDEVSSFDITTATVVNDKNEVVNSPDTMKRSKKSYTTEKTKEVIQKNKWWLIGGLALLLVSIVSYFSFFRKGGK